MYITRAVKFLAWNFPPFYKISHDTFLLWAPILVLYCIINNSLEYNRLSSLVLILQVTNKTGILNFGDLIFIQPVYTIPPLHYKISHDTFLLWAPILVLYCIINNSLEYNRLSSLVLILQVTNKTGILNFGDLIFIQPVYTIPPLA